MRLSVNNYQRILAEKRLSDEYVMKCTGLSKMTYDWLLKRGFIEWETLERIADAIGCQVKDILDPEPEGYTENVIEWVKNSEKAALSLSQRRTITRIRQLAAQYPDQCQIDAENKDGSICARIPVGWIKIIPPRELTEEQKQELAQRLARK